MSKCLYCYHDLLKGQKDFHPECSKKIFGTAEAPALPYTRDNLSELAKQVIRTSSSITGVQAKMSLDLDKGKKNEPAKFTIVGLWGKYIFKPQSSRYDSLPELEDVTMKMAEASGIKTAKHSLVRMSDGELGYITLRMDRGKRGEKISMLDFCQLSNRLTEHKYDGTYQQLADTVKRYSTAPLLDLQRYWEVVLFSWITGNSDMHCKNFSLIDIGKREYVLSPAYDLLPVLLADTEDQEEMALTFSTGGKKNGFGKNTFIHAITDSGLDIKRAEKLIAKIASCKPVWFSLIDISFLSQQMKSNYKHLIEERLSRLNNE